MDSTELKKLLVSAAKRYYKYLEEKGSGRSEIQVHKVNETHKKGVWSLRLKKKLFNLDAVTFEFPDLGIILDNDTIKIVEYDYDNRVLLVKPNKKCKVDF